MTGENAPANNVNSTGFENMTNEKPRVNHNNLKRLAAGFAAAAAIFNAGCGFDTKGYKKETVKGSMAGSSTEMTEHTDVDTSAPFTESSETETTTSDITETSPSETSIELSSSISPTETETPIQKEAKVISATPSYGYGNYPFGFGFGDFFGGFGNYGGYGYGDNGNGGNGNGSDGYNNYAGNSGTLTVGGTYETIDFQVTLEVLDQQ